MLRHDTARISHHCHHWRGSSWRKPTRSMRSPAASPPSSTPVPAASSRPPAGTGPHRQGARGPQRHRRRAHRGADRHQPGECRHHRRSALDPGRRVRLVPLQAEEPRSEPAGVRAPARGVRAHDIRYFFYNGGGDSQDTAHKVSQFAAERTTPITCIGIPKTVDNDLPLTDCCPGFGSVAKYVAVSTREAGTRRGVHVRDLHQGLRARGHGPPCRLDRGGRRARPGAARRSAAHHPAARGALRRAMRSCQACALR
jgi:hypothetical protein